MEYQITELKRCTLLEVSGRVDSSTAPKLSQAFDEIIESGNYRIVFDMNKMDFISSAGLWVMVNAQKKCKRFNRGEVVIAAPPERIVHALDLAGFIPFFKVFEDSTSAVGSF